MAAISDPWNDVSHKVSVDPVDEAGIDISQLRPFGAHFGAQKMICSRFALKKRPVWTAQIPVLNWLV